MRVWVYPRGGWGGWWRMMHSVTHHGAAAFPGEILKWRPLTPARPRRALAAVTHTWLWSRHAALIAFPTWVLCSLTFAEYFTSPSHSSALAVGEKVLMSSVSNFCMSEENPYKIAAYIILISPKQRSSSLQPGMLWTSAVRQVFAVFITTGKKWNKKCVVP